MRAGFPQQIHEMSGNSGEVAYLPAMRTHQSDCSATTLSVLDFVDVTGDVENTLTQSGIRDGQVTVFAPESSCVLVVNERETGLLDDIRGAMTRLQSTMSEDHRALLGSSSVVLPAAGGQLRLGMWQRLLLVELAEPHERKIVVQIVGE
jgi:secondary thiamine-phosphate synthase enzyme